MESIFGGLTAPQAILQNITGFDEISLGKVGEPGQKWGSILLLWILRQRCKIWDRTQTFGSAPTTWGCTWNRCGV